MALNALKSLKTSTSFQKLLEVCDGNLKQVLPISKLTSQQLILMIGNYMNSGSFIGQVYGFRISSINKLVDTKSSDGKKTLLHYLAAMVNTRFQDLKQFLVDLKDVIPGSKCKYRLKSLLAFLFKTLLPTIFFCNLVSFQTMKEDLIDLEKSLILLDSEIAYHQSKIASNATHHSNDQHGSFLKIMLPFQTKIKNQIQQIRTSYMEMETLFENIALLYGEEEPKKIKPDEFLTVFRIFMQSFEVKCL